MDVNGAVPEAVAVALLNMHAISHNAVSGAGSGIDALSAPAQLFQCSNDALGDALLKVDPEIKTRSIDIVIATMKALAVLPVATGVRRSELLELKQRRDEAFRAFAARARGKAETCGFTMSSLCTCGQSNAVDYTDNILRDVLVAGIYDTEIRREILGIEGITERSVNEVISLVEKREMAHDANMVSGNASSISSFRQEVRKTHESRRSLPLPPPGLTGPFTANRNKSIPCPLCRKQFAPYTEGTAGWNSKPHEICIDCFRSRCQRRRKGQNGYASPAVSSITNKESPSLEVVTQISVISSSSHSSEELPQNSDKVSVDSSVSAYAGHLNPIKLDHHIFSAGEWHRATFMDHPTMELGLSVRKEDYKSFSLKCPQVGSTIIQAKILVLNRVCGR